MKRLLLSILLLGLIAVAAVTPYLFGMEAERIFGQQMSLIDSSNKISVYDSRFRRGWFSSAAETTLAIRGRDISVIAEHTIEHGPFPISNPLGYLASLRPLQALVNSSLTLPGIGAAGDDLPLGTLTTTINIDGTTDTIVDIPAADAQLAEAATVAWKSVQGTIEFEPAGAAWQGAIEIGGFDWAQHESSVSLGKSGLAFHTFPGRTGLAMGQSKLTTDTLTARIPDSDHRFESSNVIIDSTATEQGQSVEYKFSGGFSSAQLPDLELSDANWHFSAQDLDLDTLTELNNLSVDSAVPLNKLLALVSKRSAGVDSGLTMQTESGPFAATARLRLTGSGSTSNPLALIGALDGDIVLEIPAAIAEIAARAAVERELPDPVTGSSDQPQQDNARFMADAVAARIQSWLDGNLLTRTGDGYRFNASVRGGSFSINGKPFNLLSLLR